jgi:hypothetical protein
MAVEGFKQMPVGKRKGRNLPSSAHKMPRAYLLSRQPEASEGNTRLSPIWWPQEKDVVVILRSKRK